MLAELFPGFRQQRVDVSGTSIHALIGGKGPPLLLLHGWPQSSLEWHHIASRLARDFTVVATDLRGYGESGKPNADPQHLNYSKRSMARDQVELMNELGFEEFFVAGHDRGGRVAHRMALDHPDSVLRLAVLDIVPTLTVYSSINKELATAYYHWFFLIQPAPFPETLLAGKGEFMLRALFRGLPPTAITSSVFNEYVRYFNDPNTSQGMCEDYRAAASIDTYCGARKVLCSVYSMCQRPGENARTPSLRAHCRVGIGCRRKCRMRCMSSCMGFLQSSHSLQGPVCQYPSVRLINCSVRRTHE
jgi:haloacetate dehalogenase